MAEVGSAFVSILPSAKGFGKKLSSQVEPETKKTGSKLGSSLGKAFAIAGGAAAAVGFVKGAIGEAREAQKVGALTAAVIKSTGGAAKISAKQVGDMAGRISNLTGIDDETIQSGENMLLTFKNIRNEVGGKFTGTFDAATMAATDMSAAMGTDVKSAALQVGKALNDPVKGMSKLSKQGVTFTDQQKKQAEQMVKNGNAAGAQAIILKELKSEFGGAAAAQATAGDKAKVAFQNLQETVGTALLPVLDKLFNWFSTKIAPAITKFVTGMQQGTGAGGKFAAIMSGIGSAIGTVFGFLSAHEETVKTFATVLLVLVGAVQAWSIAQAILNAVLTANPIGVVVVAIAALVTGLILAYKKSETFRNIVNAAFKGVVSAGKAMWGALKSVFKFIVNMWLTVVGAIIHGAAKAFGWVPGIGPKLKKLDKTFQNFRDDVNRSLNGVKPLKLKVETGAAKGAVTSFLAGLPDDYVINVHAKVSASAAAGAGLTQRATGGPVTGGQTYLVGERGPELFAPPRSGRIIPNHDLRAGGGGRQAITITNWRDGTGYIEAVADGRVVARAGVTREAVRSRR